MMAPPASIETLTGILQWQSAHHPQRTHVFLYEESGAVADVTFAQLAAGARRVAAGLQGVGIQAQDTVALMLPTGLDYLECFFGILFAGGIPVPIYPPARMSSIEDHLIRHAAILDNARTKALITFRQARPIATLLTAHVKRRCQVLDAQNLVRFEAEGVPVQTQTDDVALVQYTSGSTGQPKGVVLTNANLLANIRALGKRLNVDGNDVFVSWLPLYHDMGLIGTWLGSMCHSATFVLMSPLDFLRRPDRWLWAIHRHGGTISAAPNFAYELCLRRIKDRTIEGLNLQTLRYCGNGAERVAHTTIEQFESRFAAHGISPGTVQPVYGLAECSLGLTLPPAGRRVLTDSVARRELMDGHAVPAGSADPARVETLVSCGTPLDDHQVRVVDDTGRVLPERSVGQIEFRGPSATQGYLNNDAATKLLKRGDWLISGDFGYLHHGELYVTGRAKDVINRRGRNVWPFDLEVAVGEIDGVRQGCVAVVGLPDPVSGTEEVVVVAESRLRDSHSRTDLERRIRETAIGLLGFAPQRIVLVPVNTVPKTSSGKLRRAATAELLRSGTIGHARATWIQFARLVGGGVLSRLRRAANPG